MAYTLSCFSAGNPISALHRTSWSTVGNSIGDVPAAQSSPMKARERVLADTSALISGLLLPSPIPSRAVRRDVANSCVLIDNTATVHPPDPKREFRLPVLVSVSRKSFLRAITGRAAAAEAGPATLAAELYAASAGADFIRTHDPAALRDGLAITSALHAAALTC
jgi:hypothetical protein